MIQITYELLALLGGFIFLARGSDALVHGGENIAKHFNVSQLTIGLTVVAWGTSLPELVITTWASVHDKAGESLGTVIGSNIANLGLVLGVCAIVLPATIEKRVRMRDALWLLGSLALVFGALYDGQLSRLDGGLLLAAFVFYQFGLLRAGRAEGRAEGCADSSADSSAEAQDEHTDPHLPKAWLLVLLGSLAIGVGARLAMWGGEGLAHRVGLSETVIGLTVFAVGTSLPELFAGYAAARKGKAEMGLGNVLGSNVFNILAALGCASVVKPLLQSVDTVRQVLVRDIPIALAFSVLLLVLPFLPKGWGKRKGVIALACYVSYVTYLIVQGVTLPGH